VCSTEEGRGQCLLRIEMSPDAAKSSEARDRNGEEFGEERLVTGVARRRNSSAQEIIQALIKEVGEFCGDQPQHDDMTMVVVKVGPA